MIIGDKRARFYTTEKISAKMHRTPEGFLLCESVAIARTGKMDYGEGETPVEVGDDGRVHVSREETEVFRPETIASFNGKPVVDEHPDSDVNPDNWRELAVGIVLHPRRGDGAYNDLLIADLMITDAATIEAVLDGKRELSCGYDADYEETAPGEARQYNIIGNHVALVESGRCGPRCKIRDKEIHMTKWQRILKTVKDTLGPAFKPEHESALKDSLLETLSGEKTTDGATIHIHNGATLDAEEKEEKTKDAETENRFKKIEDSIAKIADSVEELKKDKKSKDKKKGKDTEEEVEAMDDEEEKKTDDEEEEEEKAADAKLPFDLEAPPGTSDRALAKMRDSALFEESFADTVALAEIISPGIRIPTFDSAAKPADTFKQICGLRRKALQFASQDAENSELIADLRGGRTIDSSRIRTMDCGAVRDLFFSLGAVIKRNNNSSNAYVERRERTSDNKAKVKTPADLNKFNQDFYKQ